LEAKIGLLTWMRERAEGGERRAETSVQSNQTALVANALFREGPNAWSKQSFRHLYLELPTFAVNHIQTER
jgi:hypothetical protein